MIEASHPILSCDAARALEAELFGGDETKEWAAMQKAGRAIARAVLRDFAEIGGFPADGRVLVLVGKGHNGGDALIAARVIAEEFPAARVEVVWVFGERALRPLAMRAWRELAARLAEKVTSLRVTTAGASGGRLGEASVPAYDLCLDGIFGFQFRPPADARIVELIERVNALPVRLRAAVDLPSAGIFRADFTYATGSVKAPVVGAAEAGRVRYLDLGFFRGGEAGHTRVLTAGVLEPLTRLRAAATDKRSFGHVFVVGGSRSFPGAVLMTVLAALRSGAGLVTAFVPESVAGAFAARAPEAMWVAWPETPTGGLALEGEHLLREKVERATALVLGPGLGREKETLALAANLVRESRVPMVIDADALQADVVQVGEATRIVTPHSGEWARIREAAATADAKTTVVLKGSVTKLWRGLMPASASRPGRRGAKSRVTEYRSFFGGPALARGGSGDLLAGLIGGRLAQTPEDPLFAAAQGVVWHGMAADALARAQGQITISVTQMLDYLPVALKEAARPEVGSLHERRHVD